MKLFVYGSLKRGFRHHRELEGAAFLRHGVTTSGFSLRVQGEYPALVREGTGVVHGEVFDVSDALIARLDAFEDAPRAYQRIEIVLADGTRAHTYAMSADALGGAPVVPGGRWREGQR